MKRILAAVVCAALALATAVSVSTSQQMVAQHKVTVPVTFRTTGLYATLVALDPSAKKLSGTIGYIDSSSACKIGTGSKDTTKAIALPNFPPYRGPATSTDTNEVFCRVAFYPVNTTISTAWTTSSYDSLYLVVQVSADGNAWENTGTVVNVAGTGYQCAAITCGGFGLLASPTSGTCSIVFCNQAVSRTIPFIGNLSNWPLMRLIVSHTYAAETAAGQNFAGNVTFWSSSDTRNQ